MHLSFSLEVSGVRDMRPELLINIWRAFPHLVSINLQRTIVFDAPLNIIGQACPHLRQINLAGTTVSDRGRLYVHTYVLTLLIFTGVPPRIHSF